MAGSVEARLNDLGITLPQAAAPVANYVPTVISGSMLYVSGQLPMRDGELKYRGKLGDDTSLEDGQAAARLCGLNVVAQVKAALGDLDRVVRVVKLTGFVNGTPDFTDHPKVINGASDLMAEIFADRGKHARSAVGTTGLPLGAAVEVDAVLEIA